MKIDNVSRLGLILILKMETFVSLEEEEDPIHTEYGCSVWDSHQAGQKKYTKELVF